MCIIYSPLSGIVHDPLRPHGARQTQRPGCGARHSFFGPYPNKTITRRYDHKIAIHVKGFINSIIPALCQLALHKDKVVSEEAHHHD